MASTNTFNSLIIPQFYKKIDTNFIPRVSVTVSLQNSDFVVTEKNYNNREIGLFNNTKYCTRIRVSNSLLCIENPNFVVIAKNKKNREFGLFNTKNYARIRVSSSLLSLKNPNFATRRHVKNEVLGVLNGYPCKSPNFFATKHRKNRSFGHLTTTCSSQNPIFSTVKSSKTKKKGKFKSVELDKYVTSDISECFFEMIEELENMAKEPSDVLEAMNDRISSRELQLVLVYFSQEGKDSWCALEVFEWLKKENRVDDETMELMVFLMCEWVRKLIEEEREVGDIVDLLVDMDCVGLRPGFSMVEKVVDLYWSVGEKKRAISFVEECMKRDNGWEKGSKGGPFGYLAWKMMVDGDYNDAVNLVIHFRESGLKPEVYSYLIAMTAVVKELNEFAKALRKLKGFSKSGWIAQLDLENVGLFDKYQSELLAKGLRLSKWAMQEGGSSINGMVHERLLAMYICAGCGFEAERQLWAMKMAGKEADTELCDIVLAICASQRASRSVSRLLSRIEVASSVQKKKTLSWLLRGYIKGGHFEDAAEIVMKMIDYGLCPEFLDREAVLQGLRKRISQFGNMDSYLKLCKRLYEENMAGPCLVYLYMKYYKLWMIKMI